MCSGEGKLLATFNGTTYDQSNWHYALNDWVGTKREVTNSTEPVWVYILERTIWGLPDSRLYRLRSIRGAFHQQRTRRSRVRVGLLSCPVLQLKFGPLHESGRWCRSGYGKSAELESLQLRAEQPSNQD